MPSVNGVTGAALAALNATTGAHGIGRIDLVEDHVIGVKSREVYECPGSLTLIAAYKALERLVLTRDELSFKATLDQKYAEQTYDGLWRSPLRKATDAFNALLAERMTGKVRVRLNHGTATVDGTSSRLASTMKNSRTTGSAMLSTRGEQVHRTWGHTLELGARVARDAHATVR